MPVGCGVIQRARAMGWRWGVGGGVPRAVSGRRVPPEFFPCPEATASPDVRPRRRGSRVPYATAQMFGAGSPPARGYALGWAKRQCPCLPTHGVTTSNGGDMATRHHTPGDRTDISPRYGAACFVAIARPCRRPPPPVRPCLRRGWPRSASISRCMPSANRSWPSPSPISTRRRPGWITRRR